MRFMQNSYQKIELAIHFIETHFEEQPDLDRVAEQVGLSPFHFQKLFTRLAGVSPKRFLQFTTLEEAKKALTVEANLLDASYAVGLSGPSRLHDLFMVGEAVTPGDFKRGGETLTITYGWHASPFGDCLIAMTPHGICEVNFCTKESERDAAVALLRRKWPKAELVQNASQTKSVMDAMFAEGQPSVANMKLHLRGTNFQLKVWQALLRIPEGALTDYSALAHAIGAPKANRAVGSAVGDNPIAFLIPCHRVLRKDGGIGGYATGTARKRCMLAYEALSVNK